MPEERRLTDADRVWNRACANDADGLREGDRALAALLLVDGYIQNGGVSHAYDLTPDELAAGLAGYAFFGLEEMAAIIKSYSKEDAGCNRRYYAWTRPVSRILTKFEEMHREHPERFAPVEPE